MQNVAELTTMYEFDLFEKAIAHFGTRVDIIIALEMGGKIDANTAYKEIKAELKELKRAKKQYGKDM